jgi:membrane protein required for colicin V production
MTVLDWVVILILGASVILSLMRGLVAEIFSLASWVVALLAAKWGAVEVAPMLPLDVQSEHLRYFIAFLLVFLVVMIIVMLLGRLVKGAVGAVGLGGADKVIGGIFGLLRGVVILTGLTLAAGLTAVPQTDFWKNALSSSVLETFAIAVEPLLPIKMVEHIHFNR